MATVDYFAAQKQVPLPTKDILSWIFDDPKYDQDEAIYIDAKDPSKNISSRQARVLIRKIVAGLHTAGLKKGDCVCIHSFNDIYYPILFLGIIAAGGVFAGTNPSYTQFELEHHIKTSCTSFLITEPEMLDNVLKAASTCGIPKGKIWIFDQLGQALPDGFKSWNALLAHGEKDWVRFDDERICKNTTAARLFSSGTTGLPKAVVWSHSNLIAQQTLVNEVAEKPWRPKRILALPMFHAAIAPTAHVTPLRSGHVSVVMRRFELEPFLFNLGKFNITEMVLVPPMVIAIIMSPAAKKSFFSSVKSIYIGAAPLGRESQDRLKKLLPNGALVTQVWGMTEMTCIASMFYYPEDDDTGSVGRFLPGVDVKIIDDNDRNVTSFDVRGELCVRGPIVFSGYFQNNKANSESFDPEGFFKTGDIAYCDGKTRKWYIVDRKKELIKVRGFQVAPPELETVLLSHPLIVDAAVIGVKLAGNEGKDGSECPKAYVVRRPGKDGDALDEKEVKKWCGLKLAKYKELTGGVVFLDSIPKNASGKILKRILREMAKEELERAKAKL